MGGLRAESRALPYRSGGAAHFRPVLAGYSVCLAGAVPSPEIRVVEGHTGRASPEMTGCCVDSLENGRRNRPSMLQNLQEPQNPTELFEGIEHTCGRK